MKIHEYQAKELLAAAGAPIPKGIVVETPGEAVAAFDKLGG
jgi:succinyl-CoA synthetase beta subunit